MTADLEDVWRAEMPRVLGALVRRHGDFDACEDALQEAMVAATQQWGRTGVPEEPRGWLIRVASRRLVDAVRRDRSRVLREARVADPDRSDDDATVQTDDDTLHLLYLCCHPALTPVSQVALTLRAVAGLTTAQIAAAFMVPTSTMAQRISRAKATLRSVGARFEEPSADEAPDRVHAVLHVLYLTFNEGYTSSGGSRLLEVSLAREAIRLCRELCDRLPEHQEAAGLLALMLLTDARTEARTDAEGDLVRLADQDRRLWDQGRIAEGVAILERVLPRGPVSRFQLEAAIAAVHAEAPSADECDWRQIAALYEMLDQVAPSAAVTLGKAVAVAMTDGPEVGLAAVDRLLVDPSLRHHHRQHAVRAHLLQMAGRYDEAADSYRTAARLTNSVPEQRYLNARASEADGSTGH